MHCNPHFRVQTLVSPLLTPPLYYWTKYLFIGATTWGKKTEFFVDDELKGSLQKLIEQMENRRLGVLILDASLQSKAVCHFRA